MPRDVGHSAVEALHEPVVQLPEQVVVVVGVALLVAPVVDRADVLMKGRLYLCVVDRMLR